ncbi:MAG: hypothetical protein ACRCWF_10940 [Beijerinckiaceae bacterium]
MFRLSFNGGGILADPDTLWHVATGKLIWDNMAMPRLDTWSHTFTGQSWIARDWLSQYLLHLGFLVAEWPGVAFVTWIATALSVMVVGHALAKHTSPLTMLLMSWLALATMQTTILARPHILGLPAMALWAAWLVHTASTTRRPPWLALVVMVLWSNLHAGFTIGFIIAGAIALDAIWNTAPAERVKVIASWLLFGCGCLVASTLNPYGYASLLINIGMFSGNEGMPHIDEWNVMRLHGHNVLIMLYASVLIGSLFLEARKNIFRILLGVFIVYTSIRHERFVMLLAIVPPLLAQESAPRLLRMLFDRLKLFRDSDPLAARAYWKPLLLFVPAAMAVVMMVKPVSLPNLIERDAALAVVPAEARQGKVFNSYGLGGFLVSRNVPTFIDGRTDQLFLGGFTDNYIKTLRSNDLVRFQALVDKHGASWAFVDANTLESELLDKLPGWKRIHKDEHTQVYVKTAG